MNVLIKVVSEKGFSDSMYDLIGVFGIVLAVLLSIWYGKKLGLKFYQIVLTEAVVMIVSFFSIFVIILDCLRFFEAYANFPIVFMTSIVRTLLLIPAVGLLMSKILKIKWTTICDFLIVIPLMIGGVGSMGCVFAGCCKGYPCEWGIYNPRTQINVFPVQIVNAVIMLLILIYLFIRTKRNHYVSDGLSYPVMLILFGATRLITEFFCDNEKIFFGLSVLAIHCIKDLIVGIVVYLVMKRRRKKISENNTMGVMS